MKGLGSPSYVYFPTINTTNVTTKSIDFLTAFLYFNDVDVVAWNLMCLSLSLSLSHTHTHTHTLQLGKYTKKKKTTKFTGKYLFTSTYNHLKSLHFVHLKQTNKQTHIHTYTQSPCNTYTCAHNIDGNFCYNNNNKNNNNNSVLLPLCFEKEFINNLSQNRQKNKKYI